jgi:hypothetical protein
MAELRAGIIELDIGKEFGHDLRKVRDEIIIVLISQRLMEGAMARSIERKGAISYAVMAIG